MLRGSPKATFANDNDVTSQCERSSADGGVAHSRAFLLCTAVLFWLCWQRVIDAARLGARNGHVRRRNRLARPPKRYPGISPDRDLLCGGSKCADLSYWPLAWRSYVDFGRLHRNRIGARITYLWIAYSRAPHLATATRPREGSAPRSALIAFHQRSRTSLRKSIA